MFNRKVLFIALLAVVLLGSIMDGSVGVESFRRRKPIKKIAYTIEAVDPNTYQPSLRDRRKPRKPRLIVALGDLNQAADGAAETDPSFHLASLTTQMNQAVSIAAVDPNNYEASLKGRRNPRKPRVIADLGGLNQVAGGIAGIDPTIMI